MNFAPIARIVARYGIGYFAGAEIGEQLALDPDITTVIAIGLAVVVETLYGFAKRRGWAT